MSKPIDSKAFFFDWWNNYLTIDRIAFDYAITPAKALELINDGRLRWNRDAEKEANA